MLLTEKLAELTPDNTVAELTDILSRRVTAYISWGGCRQVAIEGYEGEVNITEIARALLLCKLLQPGTKVPQSEKDEVSCGERVACHKLFEQVCDLYKTFERQSSTLYSGIVSFRDIAAGNYAPTALLHPIASFTTQAELIPFLIDTFSVTKFNKLFEPRDAFLNDGMGSVCVKTEAIERVARRPKEPGPR